MAKTGSAPRLAYATPAELGMDAQRLHLAYDLLDDWTRQGAVPGGAIVVGRRGRIVEPHFSGRQAPDRDAPPIRRDSVFLLASITKPVVYTAAMQLVEQGQLNLTERVTAYFPDFAAHHKEDTLVLHLFTHTSGLPDMLPNNLELRRAHAPLARFLEGAMRDAVPLFPPGTGFSYQSLGTLMVAAIVEKLTGQSMPDLLRQRWFHPLGMESSSLGLGGLDRQRVVRVQVPDYLQGGSDYDWNSDYWQMLGAPWGGMFSSPEDFAVYCQMLLDGGRYDQRVYLSRRTVERMTSNRLDDLPDVPERFRRTHPWGLGWRLNHPGTDDSWGDLLSARAYGHTGATGTTAWIDPEREGFCALFTSALRAAAPWRLVRLSNIVASAFD